MCVLGQVCYCSYGCLRVHHPTVTHLGTSSTISIHTWVHPPPYPYTLGYILHHIHGLYSILTNDLPHLGPSYTIHNKPYTIHNKPYTTHIIPYTIHHTPHTLHHTQTVHENHTLHKHHMLRITQHATYTIHHTPYTVHHTPVTIHHTPYTIHRSPYTTHITQHVFPSSLLRCSNSLGFGH